MSCSQPKALALDTQVLALDTQVQSADILTFLCSPALSKVDKDLLLLYQKHGENLETEPPTYGSLHPRWQKQHKHKQLSTQEWSALWQIEQCSFKPMKAKSLGHMTTLDKWTVRF